MMYFEMDDVVALEFYRRAKEAGANTEEARTLILIQMADEGLIKRMGHTNRSKEQYIEDLGKNFNVLDCRKIGKDDDTVLDAQWCYDSDSGQEVLIDRRTHQEIARRNRGEDL